MASSTSTASMRYRLVRPTMRQARSASASLRLVIVSDNGLMAAQGSIRRGFPRQFHIVRPIGELMNLHEYQSKKILASYGVPVPEGLVAANTDEADAAARAMGGRLWV